LNKSNDISGAYYRWLYFAKTHSKIKEKQTGNLVKRSFLLEQEIKAQASKMQFNPPLRLS
jgi:hypothetical protein